uniref:Transmembrane O-methyltransferase n=1 Tax=Prolemur simus TaxID=1328070 RepID=A0A8C8ZGA6_PROSS
MSRQDYMNTSVREPPLDYSFRSIQIIQGPNNFLQPECHLSSRQQHPSPGRGEQAGCPPSAPEPHTPWKPHGGGEGV